MEVFLLLMAAFDAQLGRIARLQTRCLYGIEFSEIDG